MAARKRKQTSGMVSQEYAMVKVDQLVPHERNVNEGDLGAVIESMNANGFYGGVLAQKSSGKILAGKHRWLAAKEQGFTRIPVIWLDISDEQAIRIMLADNRTCRLGHDDPNALAELLQEVLNSTGTLAGTGFDGDALDELLADLELAEEEKHFASDPDEAPEPPENPVTVLGDLWILGDHRLLCGDSTSIDAVERLMAGNQADMCFTSPPYGVGLDYGAYEDSFQNCRKLISEVAPMIWTALRDGGFAVVNFNDIISASKINDTEGPSEYPMALEYWPAFTSAGFSLHTRRIWAKPHARVMAPWTASSNRAANDWEHIWTWRKPGEFLNERREPSYFGVWDSSKGEGVEVGKDTHPSAFPVVIALFGIDVYSNPGDVVFEPFAGTGTVCVACEKRGRSARMLELDAKYCDVTITRWQNFTGKEAVLEGDGRTFARIGKSRKKAAA